MNQIPVIQNQDSQLKLLRARTQTYARASALMVFQLGLTVVVPVIGAISAMFRAELKPYVAAASLMIIVVDILLLDRYQKVLTKRAAKIGEQFDCSVLEMPWDQFTVGDKVEAEDIHSAAKTYASRHNDSALRGGTRKLSERFRSISPALSANALTCDMTVGFVEVSGSLSRLDLTA
jgi:hypothetical protein